MKSILTSFNISLKVNSGKKIEFLVLSREKDLKAVFDVLLDNRKISDICLDDERHWMQNSGELLQFEVCDVGLAIEHHYQEMFSKESAELLPLAN